MSDATPPAKAKRRLNPILVLVPVAVVAALVLAFTLPPSHAFIVNGPLKPLLARIGLAGTAKRGKVASAPPDPAADVRRLTGELETARKAAADKDARIAALQAQAARQQAAPAPPDAAPAPTPRPTATPVPDEIKRAAAYWAGMDAEKAAAVVSRLPDAYVAAVFAQMPPDAVGEIMNAMPPKDAAKLMAAAPSGPPVSAADR